MDDRGYFVGLSSKNSWQEIWIRLNSFIIKDIQTQHLSISQTNEVFFA